MAAIGRSNVLTQTIAFPRFSSSTSSKLWLKRQSKDPFVKLRAQDAYRSRSAYKLLEIDEKYRILRRTRTTIVDLGAAPGGWSEAAARRMQENRARRERQAMIESDLRVSHSTLPVDQTTSPIRIIAVDLLPIVSIPGVHTIQGDFLSLQTQAQVTSVLQGRPVDIVLSDMCGNISGNRDRDSESSLQLCLGAFSFAKAHLVRTNRLEDVRQGVLM